MGRPKTTDPRRNHVALRLTDRELEKLDIVVEQLDAKSRSGALLAVLHDLFEQFDLRD